MEELVKLPECIKTELAHHGIWPLDLKFLVSADDLSVGDQTEVWVIVTNQNLIVLKGKRINKKSNTAKWISSLYESYELKEIDNLFIENLTVGGILAITVKGEDYLLCRYSGSYCREIGLFVKMYTRLQEASSQEDSDIDFDQKPQNCPNCGLFYPEPKRAVCPKCMDKRSLFIRVMSFVPRYRTQISLIVVCMFLSAIFNLFRPYLEGRILFDEVLTTGGRYYGRIIEAVLLIILSQIAALVVSITYGRLNASVTAKVVYDIKTDIFSAMQRLSLSFYNTKQTGSLMTRVNHDTMHLQYFFHDGLPYFIVNMLTIIGIITTMLIVNPFLGALVLIPMPFVILFLKMMLPKLYEIFNRRYRKASSMNAMLNDTLTGMRVVKAFGKESEEITRFASVNMGVSSVDMDSGKFASTMFPLVQYMMGIGGLIVWGFGGWQVIQGNLTFGTLISFTGYLAMLYGPLHFMTEVVNWWSSCMNSAQRIFEILDSVPEISDVPNPVSIPHINGDITLDHVSFGYEPNKPVLHDICLDIKAGEMIGLVGHSGAGKSTLINIITRLYDIEEGRLKIDGNDIKNIAIKDLRGQIGMVLQDTVLFSGSITENIAFAKPNADFDEIAQAAKAANAHDFIMRLPDGYDTIIGKKGQDLSGGEKQRLSIARAILHNPRILILDEATASLDTETERQIQEALERLISNRTTIAIAHRLSTLRHADRLVVVEKGRIIEIGTHSELVKLNGSYYKMLKQQREALKIKGVAE